MLGWGGGGGGAFYLGLNCTHFRSTLKTESCHCANFVVIGDAGCCLYEKSGIMTSVFGSVRLLRPLLLTVISIQIRAWISNYIHEKKMDVIILSWNVGVWARISNYISSKSMNIITYPCQLDNEERLHMLHCLSLERTSWNILYRKLALGWGLLKLCLFRFTTRVI